MRKRNCNVMYKIKQKHGEKRKGERERLKLYWKQLNIGNNNEKRKIH